MTSRPVLSAALVAVTVCAIVMSAALGDVTAIILPVAYGGAGAYVAARRPTNPAGWLLIVIGWGLALGSLRVEATAAMLLAGDLDARSAFAVWANAWGFGLAFTGLVGLTVLFPDGHRPRGAWGVAGVLAIAGAAVSTIIIGIEPTILPTLEGSTTELEIANPFALVPDAPIWDVIPGSGELYPLMLMLLVVAAIGLVVRARRATGAARLQYRWFIASLVLVVIATSIWAILVTLFLADPKGPTWILAVLAFTAVPVAIGIAILRYRLYEIDRIISRTIGWAAVTGVLVAVFAGGVLALQALLSDVTQGQTLAVAASTLLAFALFQPVRRRVQRAVDRRFDRGRYDAERTAAEFAQRLRGDIGLESLVAELDATVEAAVRPSAVGVWLPARSGR